MEKAAYLIDRILMILWHKSGMSPPVEFFFLKTAKYLNSLLFMLVWYFFSISSMPVSLTIFIVGMKGPCIRPLLGRRPLIFLIPRLSFLPTSFVVVACIPYPWIVIRHHHTPLCFPFHNLLYCLVP